MFIPRYKKLSIIINFVLAVSCYVHAADLVPRPVPGVQSLSGRVRSGVWQWAEGLKRRQFLRANKLWSIQLQDGPVDITNEDMLALANQSKMIGNLLTRSDEPVTPEILEQARNRDPEVHLDQLLLGGSQPITAAQILLLIKIAQILTGQQATDAQVSVVKQLINKELRRFQQVINLNKIIELCALADALDMPNLMNVCPELLIKYLTEPAFLQFFAKNRTLLDKVNLSMVPGLVEALKQAFSVDSHVVNRIAQTFPLNWWLLRRLTYQGGRVSEAAFSPNSHILAWGEFGKIVLQDIANDSELILDGPAGIVHNIAFSADGRMLVSDDARGNIILWEVASGDQIQRYTRAHHAMSISSIALSSDGGMLALGGNDDRIVLMDSATGTQIRTLTGHTGVVNCVVFNSDGSTLVSGSHDGNIILWDVATGTKIRTLTGHRGGIYSVAFSPDSRTLVSGLYDGNIILWDVASGAQTRTLTGHTLKVSNIAFSPDGRLFASGGFDWRIILWNVTQGTKIRTLIAPAWRVLSVAFSADGRTLASASRDKNIMIWKTPYHVTQLLRGLSLEQILLLVAKSYGFIKEPIEAILPGQ